MQLLILYSVLLAGPGHDKIEISTGERNEQGIVVHTVRSPYQEGTTEIRVLLSDQFDEQRRYPVVYVLPVEPGRKTRYGDGLREVQKHNLHNKHRVLCVAPTFSDWPWYADHPTKLGIRQESYFLKVVVPLIEKTYPASKQPQDRLLLGFSKSGWGAWSLLLRHPEQFGRAAAWDAPLMMKEIGKYGTREILGTQEHFDKYRPADLLQASAVKLQKETRLILAGYGNFRGHHQQAHVLLDELKIPHRYQDGPARKHDWHSGWVAEVFGLLVQTDPERE